LLMHNISFSAKYTTGSQSLVAGRALLRFNHEYGKSSQSEGDFIWLGADPGKLQ